MRFYVVLVVCALTVAAAAQTVPASAPQADSASVTVPVTLDHNRVVIDVFLGLTDGTTKRIRGWVDNGNPDLYISQRIAKLLGLTIACNGQVCSAKPPGEIVIGGMKISLADAKEATIPLKPDSDASVPFPGMSAEINIPSTVLRHYDVLVDFPNREFTIAKPGAIHFKGTSSKAQINAGNGLIQIPSQIENKKYNLALDVGASISLLSSELFEKLAGAHTSWPHMTGAVGPANMWGSDDEANWKLMRTDRVQFGPLYLIDVPMAEFPKDKSAYFEKRAGMPTAGLLGADALLNYRVGLDYAHSLVYFEIGSTFKFPEFDVIGLTLRPEDDGRFTIVGIADFEGKASVLEVQPGDHLAAVDDIPVPDSTMGQVWSMLEGSPDQERKLTIERGGKHFTVVANVRHFLAEAPEESQSKDKRSKKH